MKIELAKNENIHFVGIGGIGMSGLALIMKCMGFKIQGSDISTNKNIERLKKNKIKISIGHTKKNIDKATILVISSAIIANVSVPQRIGHNANLSFISSSWLLRMGVSYT